jgi:hypothetical protein
MASTEEELDAALLAVTILKAENARYREALKSILLHGTCVENCGYHVDEAREALKVE